MKNQEFAKMPEFVRGYCTEYAFRSVLSVLKTLRQYSGGTAYEKICELQRDTMAHYDDYKNNSITDHETTGEGFDLVCLALSVIADRLRFVDVSAADYFSFRSILTTPFWQYIPNLRKTLKSRKFDYVSILQVVFRSIRLEIENHHGIDTRRQKTVYFGDISENEVSYIPLKYCRVSSLSGYEKDCEISEKVETAESLLTERQKTVFRYMCEGFGCKVISDKLNCSHQAVAKHMQKIRSVFKSVFSVDDISEYTKEIDEEENDITTNSPLFAIASMSPSFVYVPAARTNYQFIMPLRLVSVKPSAFATEKECIREKLLYRYEKQRSMLRFWRASV